MLLLACVLGVAFVACAPRDTVIQLRFRLSDPTAVHDLQFYVHDVMLVRADGRETPMRLIEREPWQTGRLAFIDLSMKNAAAVRDVIEGQASEDPYEGVRFTVGVPFELNHSNPLTASAPLNRGDMFWTWQSGYKFLRIDLTTAEHAAAFHLGSTGCSSASALRPPKETCAQPNVIHVELRGFDPMTQPIDVRVGEIVAALSEDRTRACTGDYSQPGCARAFAVTGLDAASGRCVGSEGSSVCDSQRLFFVR